MAFARPPEINGTLFNGFTRFYMLGLPSALLIAAAALGPDVNRKRWLAIPIEIGKATETIVIALFR